MLTSTNIDIVGLLQIITTFSVVDNIKEQFYGPRAEISRYELVGVYNYLFSFVHYV